MKKMIYCTAHKFTVFPNDIIGCSGSADIPEAEQLFAKDLEGYLKVTTSFLLLYCT